MKRRFVLVSTVLAAFFADMLLAGLFHGHFFQLALCLYLKHVARAVSELQLLLLAAPVIVESFIYHDSLYAPVLYLVLALAAGAYGRYLFYQERLQRLFVGLIVFLAQCALIEWLLLDYPFSCAYILGRFFVNLIILLVM